MTRLATLRLLFLLTASALVSFAGALQAQEEEEMMGREVDLGALTAFGTTLRQSLSTQQLNAWPSKVSREPTPLGQQRAIKVEIGARSATAGPSRVTAFDLADQAVHGFLAQSLKDAGQTAAAGRIQALPPVQDAASARVALGRLSRLTVTGDGQLRTLAATREVLRASIGDDAAAATPRLLVNVVQAALRAGAGRQEILRRAAEISRGFLPAPLAG